MKAKLKKNNNKHKMYIFFRTIMDIDWFCWELSNPETALFMYTYQLDTNVFLKEIYLVDGDCYEQFLIEKGIDKNSKELVAKRTTTLTPEEYVKKRRTGE